MQAVAGTLVVAALCLAVSPPPAVAGQDKDIKAELNRLVQEGSSGSRLRDGVLRIRKGNGWVRTRRIVGDFTLSAEFRLISGNTQLSIGIRTVNTINEWPRRGYRLRLAPLKPAELLASSYDVKERPATQVVPTVGDWHVVAVTGKGSQLDIRIDGQPVGAYTIEIPAGAILFQAAGDDAEVRNISLTPLPPSDVLHNRDFKEQKNFSAPKLVKEVKPNYTMNAMADKVQGMVNLEALVLVDGSVGGVWLTKLLHPELEHQALDAVRKWRFTPAVLNGSPTAVIVEIEMSFTLK